MANPFVKGWKYLMALFNSKIDEKADPKVQIQQAIEDAQRQHQALSQQAASVIGNQRQLEMKLSRQLDEVEKLNANARQAVNLADQATLPATPTRPSSTPTPPRRSPRSSSPPSRASRTSRRLHDQSLQAAAQAKKAVEQNAMALQAKVAERTKLLSQLEQAKMQERVSESLRSMDSTLSAPGNTPSLDAVRDKIERRYADALGSAELAQNSVSGRMMEVSSRASRWPGTAGSSRSGPRCAVGSCQAGGTDVHRAGAGHQ